ncbi:MAG: PEP-CTERM sorting domain-containing protein [Candidatus Nealsonbacteria bacterium]|nr:PEP-CTERM sorting domain-containing protein [Candidatus Nealsonbacteria bacterium]
MFRNLQIIAVFVVVLCVAADARAKSIAVNFMADSWGGGPFPIESFETAGLVPQQNWNNVNPMVDDAPPDVRGPLPGKLVDNTGVDSGAEIIWINGHNTTGTDGGNTTPNERLYRAAVNGPSFMLPSPQLQFTVSNVPYAAYDVYAYLTGFGFDAEASARIGSEEYFYEQSADFTTDGFIRATSTAPENMPLATYALFEDVTGDSFTLDIIKQGGNRGGLGGLQIVEVPEPSTLVLLCIGATGLVACAWRKRRQR